MTDCTAYPPDPTLCGTSVPQPAAPVGSSLPATGGDGAAAALVWVAVLLFLAGLAAVTAAQRRR
jgi:LPXTG-motif cell wall-anchored protein